MIQMPISPEVYAEYFPPAPPFVLVQKLPMEMETWGRRIVATNQAQEAFVRSMQIAKVLALSPHRPDDEYKAELKELIRKSGYVLFYGHSWAEAPMPPFLQWDKEKTMVGLVQVTDVAMLPENFETLLKEYEAFELAEKEKENSSNSYLKTEREKLIKL